MLVPALVLMSSVLYGFFGYPYHLDIRKWTKQEPVLFVYILLSLQLSMAI